eukprot:1160915-Prorocentrum_minimum.AAC.4
MSLTFAHFCSLPRAGVLSVCRIVVGGPPGLHRGGHAAARTHPPRPPKVMTAIATFGHSRLPHSVIRSRHIRSFAVVLKPGAHLTPAGAEVRRLADGPSLESGERGP